MFSKLQNEDALFCILSFLDLASVFNLAKSCSYMNKFIRNHIDNKIIHNKLRRTFITFLGNNYNRGQNKGDIHFLCKNILNHFSNVLHIFSSVKKANKIKNRIFVDLLLKSMDLQTSGLDILPPINDSGRRHVQINHWYCFPTSTEGRFLFLFHTTDEGQWYKMNQLYRLPFLSAAIHHPFFVQEPCLYYAFKEDPICEWDGIIHQGKISSRRLEISYMHAVVKELQQLFLDNPAKMEQINSKLLSDLMHYSDEPWECLTDETEDAETLSDEYLQERIEHYKEAVLKSFENFIFGSAYSKCFRKKAVVDNLESIHQMFLVLMEFLDLQINFEGFRNLIVGFAKLLRPSEIINLCLRSRKFTDVEVEIALSLLNRIELGECECLNTHEKYVLYLRDDTKLIWSYVNKYPYLNELRLNGVVVVSFLYDHIESQEPAPKFDRNDSREQRDEKEEQFELMRKKNTFFELPKVKAVFDLYAQENFDDPMLEISMDFIARFFNCLTNSPFYPAQISTDCFWEDTT